MEKIKTIFRVRFGTIGFKSDHPLVQIGLSYFYGLLDRNLQDFNLFLLVLSKNEQFDS